MLEAQIVDWPTAIHDCYFAAKLDMQQLVDFYSRLHFNDIFRGNDEAWEKAALDSQVYRDKHMYAAVGQVYAE